MLTNVDVVLKCEKEYIEKVLQLSVVGEGERKPIKRNYDMPIKRLEPGGSLSVAFSRSV